MEQVTLTEMIDLEIDWVLGSKHQVIGEATVYQPEIRTHQSGLEECGEIVTTG